MGIIWMIVVGFIVGLLARAIMPGEQKMGIVLTVVLGIVGSVVAGFLGGALESISREKGRAGSVPLSAH